MARQNIYSLFFLIIVWFSLIISSLVFYTNKAFAQSNIPFDSTGGQFGNTGSGTVPSGGNIGNEAFGPNGPNVPFDPTGGQFGNTGSSNSGGSTGSGSGGGGLLEGLNAFGGAGSGLNTGGTLIGYIANIIRWILGLLGTVFFVIIVLQGYLYMVSSGDSSKTAAATGAITNAVIGLLIIMGAFLITNFVTSGLIAAGA